ncbi:hypothetical protein PanWU01x14_076960 [Parasponia andersonii]|uniref:Uncharacterized protein n=1 Tax=Parasponia andersonii TaxID=3476 RepID=A0A2P5DCH3_PARAD|nr:hypothetical protein PanWU01x14_076960 [Parasponia andersonii]
MAGATKMVLINGGGYLSQRFSGRLIPKRGQVKITVVAVLLQSFSSVFSLSSRCVSAHLAR